MLYGCTSLQNNKALNKWSKAYFDPHVHPRTFQPDDLVLVFDAAKDTENGPGKFVPLWRGLYIVKKCLKKGAYILAFPMVSPWTVLSMDCT